MGCHFLLLELTPKRDVLSIIGEWNAKVGSQEIPGVTDKKYVLFIIGEWNAKVGSQEISEVTGKFGLGVWNEAGQRLIAFC